MPNINITTIFEDGTKASDFDCFYRKSMQRGDCDKKAEYFVYDCRAVCKDHIHLVVNDALKEVFNIKQIEITNHYDFEETFFTKRDLLDNEMDTVREIAEDLKTSNKTSTKHIVYSNIEEYLSSLGILTSPKDIVKQVVTL